MYIQLLVLERAALEDVVRVEMSSWNDRISNEHVMILVEEEQISKAEYFIRIFLKYADITALNIN